MNNFNGFIVNLSITDSCCNKCYKQVNKKDLTITDPSQVVALQRDFTLHVIGVTENHCTIIIQNGIYAIIRNVFINYDTEICLPDKCYEHIVTIGADIYQS